MLKQYSTDERDSNFTARNNYNTLQELQQHVAQELGRSCAAQAVQHCATRCVTIYSCWDLPVDSHTNTETETESETETETKTETET